MKDMGSNMQEIAGGFAREDFDMVEKAAHAVAMHPTPSLGEKLRIMAFVGSRVKKFKDYDGEVHDAAHVLSKVARERDGLAAIDAFRRVQMACFNCHQEFRAPFKEHFYAAYAVKPARGTP